LLDTLVIGSITANADLKNLAALKYLAVLDGATSTFSNGFLSGCTQLSDVTLPFIGTSPTAPAALITLFGNEVPATLKKLSITHATSTIQIASNALSGCAYLEELTIGALVSGIGADALKGCYGIKEIYVHSAMAPVAYAGISEEVYAGCILHVPHGRSEHYAGRTGWKEFLNCGGINEENPLVVTAIPVPLQGGAIVRGTGQYDYYAEATLEAAGSWGYEFQCWMEGADVVSRENPYIFTVSAPRTLYAVFMPIEDENAVTYTPQPTSVSFSWESINGAIARELVIYADAARTQPIDTIRLDANGNVLRNAARDLSCTVSGLDPESVYYYSLTSYDANDDALTVSTGHFTTSSLSGTDIPVVNNEIRIYPNPISSYFRISGIEENTVVTVSDITGKIVLQQIVNPDETIAADHLQPGVYVVMVNGKRGKAVKN